MLKTRKQFQKIFPTLILAAVCGLGLFVFSMEAQAASTYYVCDVAGSGTGCNVGSSGWSTGSDSYSTTQARSKATPWKTIQECADNMVAGDTCVVGKGTYDDSTGLSNNYYYANVVAKASGNAGAYITFQSEQKWGAKITNPTPTKSFGWQMNAKSYIKVIDFEMTELNSTGASQNNGESYIEYIGNHFYNIARQCITANVTGTDGMTGSGAGAITHHITFDRNVFHDIGRPAVSEGCADTAYPRNDHGLYISGDNITITNNIFYGHFSGWPLQLYSSLSNTTMNNIVVSNNTFADRNTHTNIIGHIVLSWRSSDVLIQNNIFFNPYSKVMHINSHAYTNVIVRNNITTASGMYDYTYPGITWTNNTMSTNPLFTSESTRDYTLTAASLARDTGYATSAPDHDYLSTDRPSNTLYDIGAYEYKSGAASNPADIDGNNIVNIKDIQICVKAITNPASITSDQLNKCKAVALPSDVVNIKDIQAIVRAIIGG